MRVYKKEAELEVWKQAKDGRYLHLKTFPICRWSGQLGPKRQEGDRQAPEGFYSVTPSQMNPNSAHYLSFDTGFPNAYDRAQGSTGSALMVHGTCSSSRCFAMTNEAMSEVYALAREAFRGGQKAFQFQAYPFRMTAENLVRHRLDPNIGFWRQLKEGSDWFEAMGREPIVSVSGGRYTFRSARGGPPEQVLAYRAQEEDHAAVLLEEGRPAIRTTYVDGGQHRSFAALIRQGVLLGDVSRPEALAAAGKEIVIAAARPLKAAAPAQEVADTRSAAVASDPQQESLLPEAAPADGGLELREQEPSFLTPVRLAGFAMRDLQMPQLAGSVRMLAAELSEDPLKLAAQ
jgi:murein L,D-transpeptidase YafK